MPVKRRNSHSSLSTTLSRATTLPPQPQQQQQQQQQQPQLANSILTSVLAIFILFVFANVATLHRQHASLTAIVPEQVIVHAVLQKERDVGGQPQQRLGRQQQQQTTGRTDDAAGHNQQQDAPSSDKKEYKRGNKMAATHDNEEGQVVQAANDDDSHEYTSIKHKKQHVVKEKLRYAKPQVDALFAEDDTEDQEPEPPRLPRFQAATDDENGAAAIPNKADDDDDQIIDQTRIKNKVPASREETMVTDDALFGDDKKPADDLKHGPRDGVLPKVNVATDDHNLPVESKADDDDDAFDSVNIKQKRRLRSEPPQHHHHQITKISHNVPLQCPGLTDKIPIVQIKDNVLSMRTTVSSSTRWGNALSVYWAARAMANFGGYKFQGATGPAPLFWQADRTDNKAVYRTSWMEYLPKQVGAPKYPQPEQFRQTCACISEHFHGCAVGWSAMRPLVIQGTRTAIESYMRTQPTTLAMSLQFQLTDWLIYERCCIFCHKNHGFSNIHAYDVLPKEGSYTIYTLSPPDADKNDGFGLCTQLQNLRNEYILERNPRVRIIPLLDGTPFEDFARIVYAPNLLIPSTGTSFGLWAALANNGTVHMGKANPTDDIAIYPMDLHILPVPFLDALNAVNELSLDDSSHSERERIATAEKLRDSPEGKEMIKAWFMAKDPLPVLVAN